MSRDTRRAILRGALPALVGLAVLPVHAASGVAIFFFALVATAVSFADEVLEARGYEVLRVLALSLVGAILYGAALGQTVYAHGVLEGRTPQAGLEALNDLRMELLRDGGPTGSLGFLTCALLLWCAGVAHSHAVLSADLPHRVWQATTLDEFLLMIAGAFVMGTVVAVLDRGLSSKMLLAACILGFAAAFTAIFMTVPLYVLTLSCDRIERALWSAGHLSASTWSTDRKAVER